MISPRSVIGVVCTTHHNTPCIVHNKVVAQGREAGKRKAGPPWRGGYRQARLNNKIVTHCNTMINLCICRKGAFSSQRVCALIPPWRGMGDPQVASPIECESQGTL
jgi:hypothetical protein